MKKLTNEEFPEELKKMFSNHRDKGAVILTMKKYDGKEKPENKKSTEIKNPDEYMCLIRACVSGNGNNRNKISTVVRSSDVSKFQLVYCNLLRSHMDGLRKNKKLKSKKTKT